MTPSPISRSDGHEECRIRHEALAERVQALEQRQRDDAERIWAAVNRIGEAVARLDGKLMGYLAAATILGTAVAFIAQKVLAH